MKLSDLNWEESDELGNWRFAWIGDVFIQTPTENNKAHRANLGTYWISGSGFIYEAADALTAQCVLLELLEKRRET